MHVWEGGMLNSEGSYGLEERLNLERGEIALKRALEDGHTRKADIVIIYDGQCIFCKSYIKLMRLRASAGEVLLLDARKGMVARQVKETVGLDLDDGMLVLYGDKAYYGADAMHVLASLTSDSDARNAFMASVFKREWLAHLLYPILKVGRVLALFILRRPRIRSTS
jgi:predicted DCC family thiol-disulfide oxidoreductase YuxK